MIAIKWQPFPSFDAQVVGIDSAAETWLEKRAPEQFRAVANCVEQYAPVPAAKDTYYLRLDDGTVLKVKADYCCCGTKALDVKILPPARSPVSEDLLEEAVEAWHATPTPTNHPYEVEPAWVRKWLADRPDAKGVDPEAFGYLIDEVLRHVTHCPQCKGSMDCYAETVDEAIGGDVFCSEECAREAHLEGGP